MPRFKFLHYKGIVLVMHVEIETDRETENEKKVHTYILSLLNIFGLDIKLVGESLNFEIPLLFSFLLCVRLIA